MCDDDGGGGRSDFSPGDISDDDPSSPGMYVEMLEEVESENVISLDSPSHPELNERQIDAPVSKVNIPPLLKVIRVGNPFTEKVISFPFSDTQITATPSSNQNRPPRPRLYQDTSTGPWVVYFRPKPNGKRLNAIAIARDLQNGFPSVSNIQKVRPDKMRAVVGNLKEANAIVRSEKFTIEYRVYIPARDVECDGKITEEGLTAAELLQTGVGRFKDPGLPSVRILDAFQLAGVSGQGEGKKYTPSNTWRITFAGTALPDYVSIGVLRLPVKLFVPRVMNCQKCWQLGHTAAFCQNKARCNKCGELHSSAVCTVKEDVQKCLYCGNSPHLKLSDCPKYKLRSEKIKNSLKASSKKSYKDILMNSLPSDHGNRFNLLSVDDPDSDESEECFEGTSTAPLIPRPRKRKMSSRDVVRKNPEILKNPKNKGLNPLKTKQSPPGQKADPLEYPPLESPNPQGTHQSKPSVSNDTQNSAKPSKGQSVANQPASGSNTGLPLPSDDGKFKLSDLLDLLLNLFGLDDHWKKLVNMFLPLICSALKRIASSCPLIAEIISFDA